MRTVFIIGLIAILAPLALACTSGEDTSDPTATPKPQPSRRGNKLIDGAITFKGLTSPITNGTIYVRLEDVSIRDDDAKTLIEQVIPNVKVEPSSPTTFRYLLEHRELEGKETYKIRVHVDADDSGDLTVGDFAKTESYLGTMAVGSALINTINVQVEPVTIEQTPEATLAVVRVEAPIEGVTFSKSPNEPNTYIARVISQQPNSCAQPNGYEVVRRIRDTDSVGIEVYNVVPASADVSCDAAVSTTESDIVFGLRFEPGSTSTVHINDDAFFFTASEPPTVEPINEPALTFQTMKGTIDFVGVTARLEAGTLYIKFQDYSRPDLGVRLVTERVIPDFTTEASDPGRYRYVVQYQEPRAFGEYGIEAHLDVDKSGDISPGDYVTTARYSFTGNTPPNRINVRATEVE